HALATAEMPPASPQCRCAPPPPPASPQSRYRTASVAPESPPACTPAAPATPPPAPPRCTGETHPRLWPVQPPAESAWYPPAAAVEAAPGCRRDRCAHSIRAPPPAVPPSTPYRAA